MKKDLEKLDLNLLRLLCAVVETRNTHTAAAKLGISQTSVSRGMAKLRETFGDRLFIRKAHGVEPSELAERLAEAADVMLVPFIKVLESYQDFDPEAFEGTIRVAVHLLVLDVHGGELFDALRAAFPKAHIQLVYWQDQSLIELLKGDIDIMICFEGMGFPQDIYQCGLRDIEVCIVARRGHPVLTNTSAWDAIGNLPLARVISDGAPNPQDPLDEVYRAKGFEPRVTLTTHSAQAILHKVASSDAIFYGSTYLGCLREDIDCYPLPPNVPAALNSYQLCCGYLQAKRDYPMTQVLHQVIQTYFDNTPQPELVSQLNG